MNKKKNLWFLLSLILVASMLIASCAPQSAPSPEEPGASPTEAPAQAPEPTQLPAASSNVLRVRLPRDIGDLDTANVTGSVEDTIDRSVMEGLFRFNAAGELEPQLAESYSVSPDGLTIDFTLRKGIMWQRGYGELTTEDVKFSYERFLITDPKPAYADDWSSLDHVEIVDQYTGSSFSSSLKPPCGPRSCP